MIKVYVAAALFAVGLSLSDAFAPSSRVVSLEFVGSRRPRISALSERDAPATTEESVEKEDVMFFATSEEEDTVNRDATTKSPLPTTQYRDTQTRILGSQELLMLPRQWGPGDSTFPSMNHVSCTLLSATPSVPVLSQALEYVMESHPLLHAVVTGDGEPEKRIDLFKMVRQGEPDPLTFRAEPGRFHASDVLQVRTLPDRAALDASWKATFQLDLDDGSWCQVDKGPLWKVELHRLQDDSNAGCALVLSFNHAISDQSSANRLTDQILKRVAQIESSSSTATTTTSPPRHHEMPVTMEESVLGRHQSWNDVQVKGVTPSTIQYVASKAAEGLKHPVILPDSQEESTNNSNPLGGALNIISGQTAGGQDTGQRQSTVQFRSLSKDATSALLSQCRAQGVSVSHALTAAVTLTATDFVGQQKKRRNYKVLHSLDMRRFGARLDHGETVACMAGSHDLMHGPLPDGSGAALRRGSDNLDLFWNLAREGKQQTEQFIAAGGPEEAVRVFDFAMSISDLNNLVYLTAQSKDTKGRAYSAGLTNVGVYERQTAFQEADESERDLIKIQHGRYKVDDVFYATPHIQSGCLYPVSCMTVDGELKLTSNPVSPIVSEETNVRFADALVQLLEIVAGTRTASAEVDVAEVGPASSLPKNPLTIAASAIGLVAVLSHAGDWAAFFQSLAEMKANVEDPADFWAALNFWIFFAVGHPILQPILALSDVLHGSPGPKIADLVPVSFLAGNLVVIGAFLKFKDVSLGSDCTLSFLASLFLTAAFSLSFATL